MTRTFWTKSLPALVTLWVTSGASTVVACPVCFSTKSKDQEIAYLATTAFMTALPLIALAGVVWWLRRRMTELSRPVQPLPKAKAALRSVPAKSAAR